MPTTPTLPNARLTRYPGARTKGFGSFDPSTFPIDATEKLAETRDQLEIDSHVLGAHVDADVRRRLAEVENGIHPPDHTSLLAGSPTTPGSITAYNADIAAGRVRVNGVTKAWAARADQEIFGASEDIASIALDGGAVTALTADGKSCRYALVAFLVNGAVVERGIFGAEDDDASELPPTMAEIRAALTAAAISGADLSQIVIVSRATIKRVATDTITVTNLNPATAGTAANDAHADERAGIGSADMTLLARAAKGLSTTAAATASTITDYYLTARAGAVTLAGRKAYRAQAANLKYLGTSPTLTAYALDGTTPAALADTKEAQGALVELLVSGTPQRRAVIGAAAAAAASVAPTAQQIRDALENASISGADLGVVVVCGRWTVSRSGSTITHTHVDPATNDALSSERLRGYALAAS